ncbi:ATP-grasp domain-containing protein [Enterococcus sp. AZ192]|uniref:ATP-grasp domain-containing protein n=1 Tax=unclassified Enterococcus TaxID=2608891 RepID=UPI003D2B958B
MRIALSGGRSPLALFFGNKLKQQGHEIFMLEHLSPTFATYSSIFTKVQVVASPVFHWETFRMEVLNFLEVTDIELFLPINEETLYYGLLQEEIRALGTTFLIGSQDLLEKLHNKLDFINWCKDIGLTAPKTELYQGHSIDFSSQLLKPVYSRFGQSVITSEIELVQKQPKAKMIVQEKIVGQQICVSLMIRESRLISYCAYDTNLGIENYASITYIPFEHATLTQIVKQLSENLGDQGIFSFDFMFDGENFFPIECNPRLTFGSILDSQRILAGLLEENGSNLSEVNQTHYGIKLLWLGKILYHREWRKTFRRYRQSRDVLAEAFDWQTWLWMPWVLMSYFIRARKRKLTITDYVVHDISYPYQQSSKGDME